MTYRRTAFLVITVLLSLFAPASAKANGDGPILDLSGRDWWIHEDAGDGPAAMPRADVSAPGWVAATVPGNIQADLEAAFRLKPLWYGAGDPRMADVARKDWWYRKDFLVPASFDGKRATLVFDGVDHECEVWLNGTKIGAHAGMFKRFGFDVAGVVRPGQTNQLAVKIFRMPPELDEVTLGADAPGGPNVGAAVHTTRQVLRELKSPTNAAWDWSVAVYTLGIWKGVRLEATGPARIDWTRVQTRLGGDYSKAQIRATFDVDSLAEMNARMRVRITGHGADVVKTVTAALETGHNLVDVEIPLEKPALWWPAGQGDQPLYHLHCELVESESGAVSDSRNVRFGVREIRWEQVPGASADFNNPLKLVVNGRPVRQMGSNLLPPDALFGRISQRGPRVLRLAEAAGINCLRLWGGGVILPEEMYDLADELGIMMLAEFPLANCLPETDPVFLAHLEETVRNILAQTRNHPCIVEWTGGNEMPWANATDHPALHLLRRLVREEDGRIFRATEPAEGSGAHGTYTYVYHTEPAPYLSWLGAGNSNLYRRYNTCSQMRISEFGTNSPANLEVWHREIPPSSQWPLRNDDPILIRKNVFWGALIKENWLHPEIIERLFGPAESLEELVEAGQFLGAEGLRYAMDALRRQGPALGGGFMSWNYNEPWPNGAGSYMVDSDGRPLMNYDFVRQALAPVSLSVQVDSILYEPDSGVQAELFLTSDAPEKVENVRWRWLARDRRGGVLDQGEGTASIDPQEAESLASICVKPPQASPGPVFLELRLEDCEGALLGERLHVFGRQDAAAPLAGLLKNRKPDGGVRRTTLEATAATPCGGPDEDVLELEVRNTGPMTALFCEPHPLIAYRTDLFIDGNHCFIPPNESRKITIRADREAAGGLTLAQTGWRLSCWNADDVIVRPGEDVLLAVGRRDRMCREFQYYADPRGAADVATAEVEGTLPDAGRVPFLLRADQRRRFVFSLSESQSAHPAKLRIHACDRAAEAPTKIVATLNGRTMEAAFPPGLGIQAQDPAHLALPATAEFPIAAEDLQPGANTLDVQVAGEGWFTWDAMDLCRRVEDEP